MLKRSKVCKYFVQDCKYPRFKFSLQKIESLIIIGTKSNQNRIYSMHLSSTRKSLLYRITFPELISFRKKNFDKLLLTSFFNAKSICNSVPFEIKFYLTFLFLRFWISCWSYSYYLYGSLFRWLICNLVFPMAQLSKFGYLKSLTNFFWIQPKFGVFIINFEQISHLVLVFLFLTLNM